jgi:hypothetical protein
MDSGFALRAPRNDDIWLALSAGVPQNDASLAAFPFAALHAKTLAT